MDGDAVRSVVGLVVTSSDAVSVPEAVDVASKDCVEEPDLRSVKLPVVLSSADSDCGTEVVWVLRSE